MTNNNADNNIKQWGYINPHFFSENKTVFVKQHTPKLSHPRSKSQGHKVVTSDIISKRLTHGISIPNMTTVSRIDPTLLTKLMDRYMDKQTNIQTDRPTTMTSNMWFRGIKYDDLKSESWKTHISIKVLYNK